MGGLGDRAVFVHRAWRYRLRHDPDEIRWMRGALSAGDFAVDVGAHKGAYTYWMRQSVGRGGRVLAFEPQRELARYMSRVVRSFRWDNVSVENRGLSSSEATLPLSVPGEGPSPSATFVESDDPGATQERPVRVETLDGYLGRNEIRRRISLIKCDVEGFELEVFRGAVGVLRDHAPSLLFECEARHRLDGGVQDVFAFLGAVGYRGSFFWQGRRRPIEDFHPGVHQRLGSTPYANNFVFEAGGGGSGA